MKKTISLLCLSMAIATSFAQLKVDSVGRVGIGYLGTPQSQLSIGSSGNSNYVMSLSNSDKNGLYIESSNGYTGLNIGMICANQGNNTGINIMPVGGTRTTGTTYGIKAYSGVSNHSSFGVAGHIFTLAGSPHTGAGIYGSSTYSSSVSHSGLYAGYFNGDVRVTGTIYGTLLSPSSTHQSTSEQGNEVSVFAITNDDESVTNKLQQVQLLQMIDNNIENTVLTSASDLSLSAETFNFENIAEHINANQDIPTIQTQLSSVRYGLAADQLKEVYPELVYEDADGNVSINYIEMIPLLVQSINELSAKIEELEGGNNGDLVLMSRERGEATDIDEVDETEVLSLAQNNPNPFSESTTIEVTVPENTGTAAIFIYDMSGKQEKQISISERGKVAVSVTSEGLTPGMYLYSLIADGKVVSTKKMILTK